MVRRVKNIEPKKCAICDSLFYIKDWQKPYRFAKQKCCSRQCNMRLTISYNIGKIAHNNNRKERVCKNCNKSEMVSPAFSNRPFCTRKCMAEWYDKNNGSEKHWNWQGGITEKESRDNLYEGYSEWRKSVFKRDEYSCVLCGENKSGKIEAHHIKERAKYPELILDVENGITVCKKCHKEIHYGFNKSYIQRFGNRIREIA